MYIYVFMQSRSIEPCTVMLVYDYAPQKSMPALFRKVYKPDFKTSKCIYGNGLKNTTPVLSFDTKPSRRNRFLTRFSSSPTSSTQPHTS